MEELSVRVWDVQTLTYICTGDFQDDEDDDKFDEDGDVFVASKSRFNKFGKEGTKQA